MRVALGLFCILVFIQMRFEVNSPALERDPLEELPVLHSIVVF